MPEAAPPDQPAPLKQQQAQSVQEYAIMPENEIPAELLTQPTTDTLQFLDSQMDGTLEDIRVLLDAREKEFQFPEATLHNIKMPVFPPASYAPLTQGSGSIQERASELSRQINGYRDSKA